MPPVDLTFFFEIRISTCQIGESGALPWIKARLQAISVGDSTSLKLTLEVQVGKRGLAACYWGGRAGLFFIFRPDVLLKSWPGHFEPAADQPLRRAHLEVPVLRDIVWVRLSGLLWSPVHRRTLLCTYMVPAN